MIDVSQYLQEQSPEPALHFPGKLSAKHDFDLSDLNASLLDYEDLSDDDVLETFGLPPSTDDVLWLNHSETAMRTRILQLAKEIEEENSLEMEYLRMETKARPTWGLERDAYHRDHLDIAKKRHKPVAPPAARAAAKEALLETVTEETPSLAKFGYKIDVEKIASIKQEPIPADALLSQDSKPDTGVVRAIPDTRKRRLCRHFLKGFCKRGDTCDFLHDSSIFCADEQKIFLGGLPAHMDAPLLVQRLRELGYEVINKPKVLRGFSPQICLGSVGQAQKLIGIGKVFLDGHAVDVRPFVDKKPPDTVKKSVFLGGLPAGITVTDIREALGALGISICNHPIIKAGFTPQVVLESSEEAQRLVMMKQIKIRGSIIEVRPFVNFRKRY